MSGTAAHTVKEITSGMLDAMKGPVGCRPLNPRKNLPHYPPRTVVLTAHSL